MEAKFIGNRIAQARKKLNISQAQLAEKLFISSQAVGKWERGESLPDIITLNSLAVIFGVDLNYFSEDFHSIQSEIDLEDSMVEKLDELPSKNIKKKLNWDMSCGNWVDSDFSGLKNLKEKFSSSNMQNCKFIGSDLSGILLKSNNIDRCDFSSSDISSSHIQTSNLLNNGFKECNLKGIEIASSYIMGCDFSEADFSEAEIKLGGFQDNIVNGSVFNSTSFSSMYIVDIVFEGKLKDCSFESCNFKKVVFQNSILINNFFKNNKNLKKVKFINCKADNITYAFLKSGKADLTGITLIE